MHQRRRLTIVLRLLSGLSGQPSPCVVEAGDRASGEGEQAAGLQRDEGFPWQPLLAHSEDSSAVSQASFLWTLKPALLAAESFDFRRDRDGKD